MIAENDTLPKVIMLLEQMPGVQEILVGTGNQMSDDEAQVAMVQAGLM